MKAESATEREVTATLQKLTNAYAERDVSGFLECFASDADVVLFGTGADEKRIGREQIRAQAERDWAQSESSAISLAWTSVSSAGPVAWAALEGAFEFRVGGKEMALPARVSVVFEKRDGAWLVVHAHFSTPAGGQEAGRSY